MSKTKPFTADEIIQALVVKLTEMRAEARATEERLRAELAAEVLKLRNEFLADRLAEERSVKCEGPWAGVSH